MNKLIKVTKLKDNHISFIFQMVINIKHKNCQYLKKIDSQQQHC